MPNQKNTMFKVIIRGEHFTLTKSQIEFDSPNYFTMCFLGEFNEAKTRAVELYRSPDLFPVIIDYLCGYEVLPLDPEYIGRGVSKEKVVKNLRADAEFYQLDGLVEACDEFLSRNPSKKYLLIGGTFAFEPTTPISERTSYLNTQENFKAPISKDRAIQEIVPVLSGSPGKCNSFADHCLLASIDKFVDKMLSYEEKSKSKLIGWKASYSTPVTMELLILMKQWNAE